MMNKILSLLTFLSIVFSMSLGALLTFKTDITNASPSECYDDVVDNDSSEEDKNRAASLCLGATSQTPAECYDDVVDDDSSEEDKNRALSLCRRDDKKK